MRYWGDREQDVFLRKKIKTLIFEMTFVAGLIRQQFIGVVS